MRLLLLLCALLWMPSGPSRAQSENVTVFAAASLAGVLERAFEDWPTQVTLSYGGSGAMARQVAAGAPADLLVLASPDWLDWLKEQGILHQEDLRVVASNSLVVIGPAEAPLLKPEEIAQRLGDGRLAMGHRSAVPAGLYASQWLQRTGLWQDLEHRLAETDNVRAALALVARGQTPLGIVYASDARAEPAVQVLYPVPPDQHDPILYPAAALTEAGKALLVHLESQEVQTLLVSAGFMPVAVP